MPVPRPTKWFVYDLVVRGKTVYVGFTAYPERRARHHISARKIKNFELVVVSEHDSEARARDAEAVRIIHMKPKHNVTHRHDIPQGGKRRWDKEKALRLFNKGWNQRAVANAVGVHPTTFVSHFTFNEDGTVSYRTFD